jgi:hypothetical protein
VVRRTVFDYLTMGVKIWDNRTFNQTNAEAWFIINFTVIVALVRHAMQAQI